TVTHQDRTHVTVRVVPTSTGPSPGAWLVLGQSQSSGWQATGPGGRSLGPSTLIDGFANGWYLRPGSLPGPTTFALTWSPQRLVWAAIGVSAAGLTGVSALAWLEPAGVGTEARVRRRGRRRGHGRCTDSPAAVAATAPTLRAPWGRIGAPPSWGRAVLVAAAVAIAAGLASRPIVGAVIGPLVLLSLRVSRGRAILALGAPAVMVVVAGYVLDQQHAYHYLPTINWPGNLDAANGLAWLATALLLADAVVVAVRQRAGQATLPRA
nr:hypothetical protein [Actinomycetota bacterium]